MCKKTSQITKELAKDKLKISYVIDQYYLSLLRKNRFDLGFCMDNIVETKTLIEKYTLKGKREIGRANSLIVSLLRNSVDELNFITLDKLNGFGWKYPDYDTVLDDNKVTILFVLNSIKNLKSEELKKIINPYNNIYVQIKGIYDDSKDEEFKKKWYSENTVYPLEVLIECIEAFEKIEDKTNLDSIDIIKFKTLYEELTKDMMFYQDYCVWGKYFMQGIVSKGVSNLGFIYLFKELLDRNNISNKFIINKDDVMNSVLEVSLKTKSKYPLFTTDEKEFYKMFKDETCFIKVKYVVKK